ncbi:hypothetical protein CGCTS75_v010335 [Colletotrichum tropicale]|nr:hypothetical protein CGCTS75_v010335 [Colletotrichum tropicale]
MGRPLFSGAVAVRRTVPWTNADEYLSWPMERLIHEVREYTKALEMNADSIASSAGPFHGRDFWIQNIQRQELRQRSLVFLAHFHALLAAKYQYHQISSFEDWMVDLDTPKLYQTRFLAHVELERVARRCAFSATGPTATLHSDGFSIYSIRLHDPHLGEEHLRDDVRFDHQEMRLKMAELYCGSSALENNDVWDPVLGGMNPDLSYRDSILLFPYRSRDTMLRIFGCFSNSVCKADNGLFLPPSVSRAIEEGVLAIVPDVGMEPPSKISQTELFESHFDEWMNNVQDYQLIVINEAHPLVHDTCKITTKYGVVERELGSLHGHKLKFKTSMRPRVSFVGWSFLSAALVASWRCLRNYEHTTHAAHTKSQVEKAIRYWGKSAVNLLEAKVFIGFLLAMGVTERESYIQNRDDLGVAIVAIERAYPMQNPH